MNLVKIQHFDDKCQVFCWYRDSLERVYEKLVFEKELGQQLEQKLGLKGFVWIIRSSNKLTIQLYDAQSNELIGQIRAGEVLSLLINGEEVTCFPYDYFLEGEARCGNDPYYDPDLGLFKMPYLR